jgi:NAD(P)-dependent dehydrogenase (short-subunit alcohol dehydrogenase family)
MPTPAPTPPTLHAPQTGQRLAAAKAGGEKAQGMPASQAAMATRPDCGEASYRGAGKLTGKAALITGADSGIGRAVAIAYAREGADVAVVYNAHEEDAREVERLVQEAGRRCLLLRGDVADDAFCAAAVRDTAAAFGRLDILVNNAAILVRGAGYVGGVGGAGVGRQHRGPLTHSRRRLVASRPLPHPATVRPSPHLQYEEPALEELDLARARRVFDVNVLSNLALCKAALPHFGQGGGGGSGAGGSGGGGDTPFTGCSVIFCTSINAAVGHPTLLSYTATKGAQASLMRSLAKALVGRGVRVNAVRRSGGGRGSGGRQRSAWGCRRGAGYCYLPHRHHCAPCYPLPLPPRTRTTAGGARPGVDAAHLGLVQRGQDAQVWRGQPHGARRAAGGGE